jgi:hypothetical protein
MTQEELAKFVPEVTSRRVGHRPPMEPLLLLFALLLPNCAWAVSPSLLQFHGIKQFRTITIAPTSTDVSGRRSGYSVEVVAKKPLPYSSEIGKKMASVSSLPLTHSPL